MQLIAKNEQLLAHFIGKNSLLDGSIEKIEIFEADYSVNINIQFNMRPSSDYQKIKLNFCSCKEFSFYYSEDIIFYNVERVKFFYCENGLFYISFDPYDETNSISDEDHGFILCKEVLALAI